MSAVNENTARVILDLLDENTDITMRLFETPVSELSHLW